MQLRSAMKKKLDTSPAVQAIRQGLIMTIPLLMIGSFALILIYLPVPVYQRFIETFAGGRVLVFFTWINQVTYGLLGICSAISISYCYARFSTNQAGTILGAVFVSLSVSMIFNGMFDEGFSITAFGAQGMFTAIFSGVLATAFFCRLVDSKRFTLQLYTMGADTDFNNVISIIVPATIVIISAYLFNAAIRVFFGVSGFEALFNKLVLLLFSSVERESISILLYVFLSSLLWFFGIHGTNVLNSVEMTIFPPGLETGGIVTKPFIDSFVLMGGCGATISLLVAILLFSRQKNIRSLANMAAFPMLFNINELMVYGLPIVFNSTFFIPFITTPLVCAAISYGAISIGLVPPPQAVSWVTPILLGGYQATGSVAGLLLQVVNITVGTLLYRWFLLRYEAQTNERIHSDLKRLIARLQDAEASGSMEGLSLLEMRGGEGSIARILAEDLRHVLTAQDSLTLYYQPQYDNKDRCIGAEALLRWNHPRCGMIYPPLLIGIAGESGQLPALERVIFQMACRDIGRLKDAGICPPKISVNATGASLQDESFNQFIRGQVEEMPWVRGVLCIELTEQMSFLLGETVESKLKEIQDMGILFAVDDFSMGHTSLQYLQSKLFDVVKLDGSLIRNMVDNPRSKEIISSIVHMSQTMQFHVLAEFVETAEQRDMLDQLGCRLYQGYYYSPAIPLEDLISRLYGERDASKASGE